MVNTAYNAAVSGLQAASLQLRASANNVANSDTDGYQKQQVTTQAGTYGVEVKVEKVGFAEAPANTAGNLAKIENQRSNVDLTDELIEMKAAKNLFEANVKTLQAQETVLGRILDIRV
jgi:flagellar basal-body rod protein FlgC